jgi:CxxC-x17-CxxC domain-containing protein
MTDETPKPSHVRGKAPALTHGTKVHFNIVCGKCGESDVLPFVPKTRGELLCRKCAEEVFGEDWANGRDLDQSMFSFECAKCGKQGSVPFEPDGRRELLCDPCHRGDERSNTQRLVGKKIIT